MKTLLAILLPAAVRSSLGAVRMLTQTALAPFSDDGARAALAPFSDDGDRATRSLQPQP